MFLTPVELIALTGYRRAHLALRNRTRGGTMTVVMGRPKTQFRDLPQRLFARERRGKVLYYYRGAGKYLPLGSDRAVALRRWFEIEQAATATPGSFQEVAEHYREEVLPTKAPKTQYEQKPQLTRLIGVFGHMPV